jgi:hypothetical protein
MTAGRYDIRIEQGADWSIALDLTDSTGGVVNLTDYTAKFTGRMFDDNTSSVIILTSNPPAGIVITPATGHIVLSLTAAQTALLSFSEAVYDLQITSISGIVTVLLRGNLFLIRSVTR